MNRLLGQQAYADQAAMQHDGFVDWVGVGGGNGRFPHQRIETTTNEWVMANGEETAVAISAE